MICLSMATRIAFVRLSTPNFFRIRLICVFTVVSLMNKCSAISLFFSPCVIFLRISLSFRVRPKALFCFIDGGEDADANPDAGANSDGDADADIGMGVDADGDEKAGLAADINGDLGIDS